MRELYLISTFQAKRLLRVEKSVLQEILNNKKVDYVRDSDQVYRISLESLILYAESNLITFDRVYLYSLKQKIHPWREIVDAPSSFVAKRSGSSYSHKKSVTLLPSNDELFPSSVPPTLLELKKMGFSARALHLFRTNGISSVEQLTNCSAQDLKRLDNLGRKTLNGIRTVLEKYNLSLRATSQE